MLVKIYVCLLFYWTLAVLATGFTILAEGGPATERTTDLSLRCDVTDLSPEDELVRVTWSFYDRQFQNFVEIFTADLTSDVPAYSFSDSWNGRALYEAAGVGNLLLLAQYVSKDLMGDYRCQINSLLSSGVANVQVDVYFGPGTSVMTTPGGRVEQQEGDSLTLTCTAQCNPPCAYRWYKAGKKISDDAILEMTGLTNADAGLYACQARNDAGRSIKPVDLRISYQTSLVSVNISGIGVDLNTGFQKLADTTHNLVASCEVKGWPEVSVEWFKDGISSWHVNSSVITQLDLDRKLSQFDINPPTCSSNGEYTCKASNGFGSPVASTAILNLACSPYETNHSSKCQSSSSVDWVVDIFQSVEFFLCFYGYPEPVVDIVAETDVSKESVYHLKVVCDRHENQCEAKLQLNITGPQHYGTYQVKISNSQGLLHKNYRVISQQPPISPTFFHIVNSTQTSVCFAWDLQFNGGSKQTYSLSYRQKNNLLELKSDDDRYLVVMIEEDEPSAKAQKVIGSCIHNLVPYSEYETILTSSNKYGRSKISHKVTFSLPTIDRGPSLTWLQNPHSDTRTNDDEPNGESGDLIMRPGGRNRQKSPKIEITTKGLSHLKDWNKELLDKYNDLDDDTLDDHDDVDENDFQQLFDSFFALDALTDLNSSFKPKAFSNFSAHLRKLVNSYARTHQNGSRHSSLNKLSLPTHSAGDSTSKGLTTTFSTTVEDSQERTGFFISLIVSASSVTAMFIMATVITLACKGLVKKRRRLKECQKRHMNRMKMSRGETDGMEVVVGNPRNDHLQTVEIVPFADLNTVPTTSPASSILSDIGGLHPSTSLRPRLATPKLSSSRQKLISSSLTMGEHEDYSATHDNNDVPEVKRASCPSYLDLCASASNVPPIEALGTSEVLISPRCVDMFSLSRVDTLTPPLGHYSSTDSIDQTSVKQLSDTEDSTKYLDLYEALAVRSRSRSPSNIYDPVHFDIVKIEPILHSDSTHTAHKFTSDASQTINEAVQNQVIHHSRLKKQSSHPNNVTSRVQSLVQCLEGNIFVPASQKSERHRNTTMVNYPKIVHSINRTIMPNHPDPRKSLSDGYLKPRDLSYVNAQSMKEASSSANVTPSKVKTKCKVNDTSISKNRNYANMRKSKTQGGDEVFCIDKMIKGATNQSSSLYEEGVTFAKDSHYVDVDKCLHCRPYIDMKAKLHSQKKSLKSCFIDHSVSERKHSQKQKSDLLRVKSCDFIRPLSVEYLTPFVKKEGPVLSKQKKGKSLNKCQKHQTQPKCQVHDHASSTKDPTSLDTRQDSLNKTNDVKAYMVTDCLNINFPEDNFIFGPRDQSQPDQSNIYDEVITPVANTK
ncbi:carcinoembryonic antigen-related cell adhesion molecule 1 [Biomphalaria glabrata]|nr:hemicentin-1-like [Biomphalaria glabrata]